jgi:cellulose synthase/poly-beta-1,6-N-acetylglucosamine synthase-like glycosyltransferase
VRESTHTARDGVVRRLQRWTLLGLIATFAGLLFVSYASLVVDWARGLPLIAGRTRQDLLIAATAYAAWVLLRPMIIAWWGRGRPRAATSALEGASVVIPCCDAAHLLGPTVETILAQTYRPIEVILVENNSTDDTWRVCQALERQHRGIVRACRVDVHAWEYACSVAINVGVRMAQHEAIIRMDCDTIMSPTMVEEAVRELSEPGTSAVAVNLRLANPLESVITRLQSIEYLLAMELDRRFQVLFGSVVCCSGGLSAYRRSTILDAGGFCSAPKWVSEDLDMTMKAHRLGHVRMAPAAIGFTWGPSDLAGIFRQRVRWGTTGIVAFYLHHRGIGRRSYWFDGRIGFFGLPMLGVIKLRDIMAFSYVVVAVIALLAGGWRWLAVFALIRMVAVTAQLLLLWPTLRDPQGMSAIWLVPAFICVYGPLMLTARCTGAWRGIMDIRRIRRKIVNLEHAGLDPQFHLSRGLDVAPMRQAAGDEAKDEPAPALLPAGVVPDVRLSLPVPVKPSADPDRRGSMLTLGLVAVAAGWTISRRLA